MNNQELTSWLLEGDVSLQYQTWRDLLGVEKRNLQKRIAHEGWGLKFLSKRYPDGHWGDRFYQPKWISSHYTLLDLRNLNLAKDNVEVKESINLILNHQKSEDGGIKLGPSTKIYSDVCVNAMVLNYASYFNSEEKKLHSIIDCILNEKMPDGGFNCQTLKTGSTHSSLHTTLSVLEGITEFQKGGYCYKTKELEKVKESALEFILMHRLFISDRTGQIIDRNFLKITYPCRWKYDILRALDYFQYAGIKWDNRMNTALDILINKRKKDGRWNMQAAHPGKVYFIMEHAGIPSRCITLRMLRVLKHFNRVE